jgi:hypothetical protein
MNREHCEITISTAIQSSKAARGTKRVCQACETRFYDLGREPIMCPSCGVPFTVVARPLFSGERGSSSGKTGWRSKAFKRPKPPLPVGEPQEDAPEISQDATEETPSAVPEDDLVLEQEPDDADVTELVDHDIEEPKES